MKQRYPFLFIALLLLGLGTAACAQSTVDAPEPLPSPHALAKINLDNGAYVKVTYGSPRKRDREIFGGLVPYGEVWRTGANDATEITFTQAVNFGGESVAAGTYTLFTIPNANSWTIILNSTLGQWGAYRHNADNDVLRVDVSAETISQMHEAFTISWEEADGGANLVMVWDQTKVSIPVR